MLSIGELAAELAANGYTVRSERADHYLHGPLTDLVLDRTARHARIYHVKQPLVGYYAVEVDHSAFCNRIDERLPAATIADVVISLAGPEEDREL